MLNLTRVGLWLLVGRIVFKFIINLAIYTAKHMAEASLVSTNKGRTIRKVIGGGGGWGKKKKKNHARENAKKKN